MTYPKKSASLPGSIYLAYGEDKERSYTTSLAPTKKQAGKDLLKIRSTTIRACKAIGKSASKESYEEPIIPKTKGATKTHYSKQ